MAALISVYALVWLVLGAYLIRLKWVDRYLDRKAVPVSTQAASERRPSK